MDTKRILLSVLEIVLGTLMFVYGGYDDSPGGQLLGLAAVMFGVAGLIKNWRNHISLTH